MCIYTCWKRKIENLAITSQNLEIFSILSAPFLASRHGKSKLRTTRASKCETMLAPDTRYRARDQEHRRGWNEDGLPKISRFTVSNFTVHRSQKSSAAFRGAVFHASFSFCERVSHHTAYNAKGNCGARTLAFRSRGDVFHEDLTKRNVSSSTSDQRRKTGAGTQGTVMVNDERAENLPSFRKNARVLISRLRSFSPKGFSNWIY